MAIDDIKAVEKLANHLRGRRKPVSPEDYALIEDWAKSTGQKKYRKSVFRGFRLHGDEKEMVDILNNKPMKFSARGNRSFDREAESWSTDPGSAVNFGGALLESRPSPKDVVVKVDEGIIRAAMLTDASPRDKNTVKFYGEHEKEIIVRTGRRKYTLCRNIILLMILREYLANSYGPVVLKDTVLVPLMKRMNNNANAECFKKDLLKKTRFERSFNFACGGGNLVYLATRNQYDSWLKKLKSR